RKNKRRLLRALEVCLLTGKPFSAQRTRWKDAPSFNGVLVFRERTELYDRINRRVEKMFTDGVVEEVRGLGAMSPTAAKTLGLTEIRQLIAGKISGRDCIAKIQQASRRYAKRQLTWFQRQDNFESLNLSLHGSSEAIESIAQSAARVCANG
ncbi:MAG: tRNA dimethylallyltransferase, partial [Verrucomicrobiota bacterium]